MSQKAMLERFLDRSYKNSLLAVGVGSVASKISFVFVRAARHSLTLSTATSVLIFLKVNVFQFASDVYWGSEVMNALGRAAENSRWVKLR